MTAVALSTASTSAPALRGPLAVVKPHALLMVDFENICRTLGAEPFHLTRGAAREQSVEMLTRLRQLVEEAGYDVHCARAFADWDAMPLGAQRALAIAGIEPFYIASLRGKSSTDIELSLEVLEAVLSDDSISHVVIAGGDRDYLPIVRRLRHFRRTATIAALSNSIGVDLRAFVTGWSYGAILELDSWVTPASAANDVSGGAAAEEVDPAQSPFNLVPSDEAPSTEPSAVVSLPALAYLTEAQRRLVSTMEAYKQERRVCEIHLGSFFRYLHDSSHFGLQHAPHPQRVLEELKAAGIVEVVRRPARDGRDFAVAILHQDRIFAGTAGAQLLRQTGANDNDGAEAVQRLGSLDRANQPALSWDAERATPGTSIEEAERENAGTLR